ncbi:MAG: HDOD domain-containing protein [Planctomycetota bacterium]|jgi:putative nucleotidyltransferase with HDIG domain
MPELNNHKVVSRQVERIVRKLSSLSTLPVIAADLLAQLTDGAADPALLIERIESDPALTARVLALAHQEHIEFSGDPTVAEAVSKLSPAMLREAVISVKVFEVLNGDEKADAKRLSGRKEMALHSLAVGCCAGQIAEKTLEPEHRQTAYLAGLLHDIGKCALDEVMPQSFAKMVDQARGDQSSLAKVEQEHLGLDHAVLGKRLGQKWNLPEPIISAIWLHHCDAQALIADIDNVQIIRIVALADRLVRQLDLGHSGSFDRPDDIEELSRQLSLTPSQIQEIGEALVQEVRAKRTLLGLEASDDPSRYYAMVRKAATGLAEDNRKLSSASRDYAQLSSQADLIDDLLSRLDENASALEIAQLLGECRQQHYRSGLTCVFVVPDSTEPFVEMAVVDRRGRSETKTLQVPEGMPPIPEVFRRQSAVLAVADAAKWLTEQLDADFNPSLLKMAPLKMADEVVGVLIFETFAEQGDSGLDASVLLSCKVAASAIAMAQSRHKHELLAERFVQVMGSLRQTRAALAHQQSLSGLAEMAAGAAHELNNPLAVISGRVQLLSASEADEDKKQMLTQIQSRTDEISQIVSDLLTFARPPQPQKQAVAVGQLLDKAVQKTSQACGLDSIEIGVAGDATGDSVYVDVHQVTQAVSSVLINAMQSYKGGSGPVWADCNLLPDGRSVSVAIRDSGCGMEAEAIEKAFDPFFSSCAAGRRRGMGLAHAQRLLSLNSGGITLTSQANAGTTVTVILPKV